MLKRTCINIFFVFGSCILLFSSSGKSVELNTYAPYPSNLKDTVKCGFTWIGSVNDNDGNKLDNFQVTVLSENNAAVIQKIDSKNSSRCTINMPMNKKMVIILEKEGYVAKKVALNTEIPEGLCNKKFILSYSAILFKQESNIDVSELDKPIAFIKYDKIKRNFFYDPNQVAKINNIIKKRYKDYYKKTASKQK